MNLILLNWARKDLPFISHRSVRLKAIGYGFIVILFVDIFALVQPNYSRASAAGTSMVIGVFVKILKNGHMLYLELHLDYCRH